MPNKRKVTKTQVAQALRDSQGTVAFAARLLGVSQGTIYYHINTHPACQEAQEEAREALLDEAEMRLYQAMKRGEQWAIVYMLKTKGKTRGWGESSDTSTSQLGLWESALESAQAALTERHRRLQAPAIPVEAKPLDA